jgi:hypothetical protein
MTPIALRGMAGNKIGCGGGYERARPAAHRARPISCQRIFIQKFFIQKRCHGIASAMHHWSLIPSRRAVENITTLANLHGGRNTRNRDDRPPTPRWTIRILVRADELPAIGGEAPDGEDGRVCSRVCHVSYIKNPRKISTLEPKNLYPSTYIHTYIYILL